MASSSAQSTPAHSHPLSQEEVPSRGRRSRGKASEDSPRQTRPQTDYFALKAKLESSEESPNSFKGNWDGSVRGYGKGNRRCVIHLSCRVPDVHADRDHPRSSKLPPLIVVEPSFDDISELSVPKYEILSDTNIQPVSPTTAAKILSTKWHQHSDDTMRAAVTEIGKHTTDDASADDPCYAIMRVLSSAVHNLTRARQELEESRRALQEKEAARKDRALQLLQELQPSDKEIGSRVFQSLFPNDDETTHDVHRMERQQSLMVRPSWSARLLSPPSLVHYYTVVWIMPIRIRGWDDHGYPGRGHDVVASLV